MKSNPDFVAQAKERFKPSDTLLVMCRSGGRSERYFMVWLDKKDQNHEKNELLKVKLIKNNENGLIGHVEISNQRRKSV
jgi:hypothetical protein